MWVSFGVAGSCENMGYKLAVGWVSRPYAESDVSFGCYLAAAGDTGRDDADVAALLK